MRDRSSYQYVIAGLVLLIIFLLIWRVISVRGLEKEMARQQAQFAEQSRQMLHEDTRHALRLASVPLVWAVRREMIHDNMDQVNQYMTSLIREKNIEQILLVREDGVVFLSTDKKNEGAAAENIFPKSMLEQNDVTIVDDGAGTYQVFAPVMGLNARMGTLILVYRLPQGDDAGKP